MKMPDWKSVFLDCSNVAVRFYDKSARVFIKEGLFAGYAFWHPAKLVNESYGGLYEIVFNAEKWVFVLKKTEKEGDFQNRRKSKKEAWLIARLLDNKRKLS